MATVWRRVQAIKAAHFVKRNEGREARKCLSAKGQGWQQRGAVFASMHAALVGGAKPAAKVRKGKNRLCAELWLRCTSRRA
eukprot:230278-Chlamydomonas_euryale.AAC.1